MCVYVNAARLAVEYVSSRALVVAERGHTHMIPAI